jgi:F-type H+-transporting ATPase subunit a
MHHISDSHEWHFWGEGESAVTLSLPIILWTDNGLVGPFLSSKFHHNDNGQIVVIVDGHSLVKIHDKIYELNQGQKKRSFR